VLRLIAKIFDPDKNHWLPIATLVGTLLGSVMGVLGAVNAVAQYRRKDEEPTTPLQYTLKKGNYYVMRVLQAPSAIWVSLHTILHAFKAHHCRLIQKEGLDAICTPTFSYVHISSATVLFILAFANAAYNHRKLQQQAALTFLRVNGDPDETARLLGCST